ncbi:hypothetical protein DFH27DRAFT_312361 [Peziza echinospora]|nr:hypothetical protein DFH27DRAFT_312361 [Peziza echinospora]
MSLFNRISAPAGLSTPTPGGSSIFGTPAASQSSGVGGGLFGGAAPAATPASGGLFGTPAASSSAAAPGSLFSTPAPASSGGGGLFGNTAANTTAQGGAGGGLFGMGGAAQPSAPAAGGLFGTAAPAAAPASGGLFGGAAPSAAPSSLGGLFGASSTTPAATGSSLFGGAGAASQPPKPSLNLFGIGGPTATAQNTYSTTNSAPSFLSGQNSMFNNTAQSQQQPQQQGQAVKIDWTNLAPYHKFNELHDNVKQEVEAAEKYILAEIQKSEGLAAAFPEHREMIQSVSGDAELMERRLLTTNSFLQSDASALDNLVKYQKLDDQHASLSVRTLDLLRLPHAARMLQSNLNNQSQQHLLMQQQQQQQQQGQQGQSFSQPFSQSQYPNAQNNMPLAGSSVYAPIPTVSSTTTNEIDITSNVGMMNYFNRHGAEMETKLKTFLDSLAEVEASLASVEAQAQASAGGQIGSLDATGGVGGRQDSRRLNQTLRGFNDALNDVSVRVVEAKEGLRELQQTKGGRRLL